MAAMKQPQRVAIVHDWFTGMRGGEKCVEALCEVFPQASLFSLVHVKGSVSPIIEGRPIQTSFIQNLPLASTHYRHYLPLFPRAVEQFDLRGYEIVISSSHCVAKGVRTAPGTLHICYCYTPMRYIWGLHDEYFAKGRAGLLTRFGMGMFVDYLRRWDVRTAQNPHCFVAISEHVRQRIAQTYQRTADVIFPPVDADLFQISTRDDGYYLIVSALVPYKRIDLAIDAFNETGDRLVIIGSGPDAGRLRQRARSNTEFKGWQSNDQLKQYYAGCRALIFPGEEDFGIVPLEAMASGKPVIAYSRGGALETVIATPECTTGILFETQTVDAMNAALEKFKHTTFNPDLLRAHALKFDRRVFKHRMSEYVERKWEEFVARFPQP